MASKRAKKMIAKLKKEARNPEGLNLSLHSNAKKMSTKMTWPEREFKKLLKELKVPFEVQKVIGNKIFDFYIPKINLLVEVDGDYWHGNPRVYDPDDKIFYGKTFGELYEKTLKREEFLISCGYSLVTIWEDTWDKAVKRSKNDINQLQQQGMPEAI